MMGVLAQANKVLDGRLRFILAKAIGSAFVAEHVPADAVLSVMTDALAGR